MKTERIDDLRARALAAAEGLSEGEHALVGDPDLADVVEHGDRADVLDLVPADPQPLRDRDPESLDLVRVPTAVAIARLDRCSQ